MRARVVSGIFKKTKMKKVYVVHGWGGSPSSECWFGWLKRELTKRNIKVDFLEMPNTNNPKIGEWVSYLNNTLKELDEQTYFIGHSIGCQAIIRYLEQLPENIKVAGCIFVAGFFNLPNLKTQEEIKIARPWIETPINFEKINIHTRNFLAFFSNDDPDVPVSDSKLFKKRLGAKIIIKENEEHFNETQDIPEMLDFLK